jgi:polyisoprenoid-binding protein YceI
MKRKRLVIAAALAMLLVLLAGCGSKQAPAGEKPAAAGAEAGATQAPTGSQAGGSGQASAGAQASGSMQASAGSQASGSTQAPASTQASGSAAYVIAAQESVASYSVREKFLQQDLNAVAVGKTSTIDGELILQGETFKPATVKVDLRTLKSDRSRRDEVLRTRGLETEKYPFAEFTLAEVTVPQLRGGQEVAFKLAGKMKLHGTEKPLTWDARATLQGDVLKLAATVTFKMQEFNIEPPNILNVIAVDDEVKLDVQLTAKKR